MYQVLSVTHIYIYIYLLFYIITYKNSLRYMAALPCMHKYTCVFIVVSLDLCLYHLYHPLEKARGGVSASFPPLGRQLETLETFERVPQIHANPTPKDQHCPASIGICSTNQTWTSTSSLGCWQGEPGNWSVGRWRRWVSAKQWYPQGWKWEADVGGVPLLGVAVGSPLHNS